MKTEQQKPKEIPLSHAIAWLIGVGLVSMFAALGIFITIMELKFKYL